jgi:hypothetical protein
MMVNDECNEIGKKVKKKYRKKKKRLEDSDERSNPEVKNVLA